MYVVGKCRNFKEIVTNRYLDFRLKRVLQEFDLICENLDKDNFVTKDNICSSKCMNLLSYVSKKTKTMFVPHQIENNFGNIESLVTEQGINLSSEQKTELLKRFSLSNNRKKLAKNIIEPLEFLKNSKLFKDSSIILQNAIDKTDRTIRCFGLSEEVKNVVIKSEDNLGVKIDISDFPDLAKNIYSWLSKHKKSGFNLPKEISFNDFDFFSTHNIALSASYVSGIKPYNYNEIISKYSSARNEFSKKKICFNPIFLISRQGKNDSNSILEDLEHELGHFWHNIKIGDKIFNSKRMNCTDGFLTINDNNFLLDLKDKLKKKVCFIPSFNLAGEMTEDLSEILPNLQNMIEHRQDLGIENILTKQVINEFNKILKKLEVITNITLKSFPDCEDEVVYALTSPKELVAFAIQKRYNHKYDTAFLKILTKLGMPEMKD